MSQREIYLVRHGEDNRSELTERGRLQAQKAAEKLLELVANPDLATIMTSDRLRAGQTADIIARAFDSGVVVSRELGDAGVAPLVVREFIPFLDRCLTRAGLDYDPYNPLIVVTHAPMLAAALGTRESEIANGQVERYDGLTWDVNEED